MDRKLGQARRFFLPGDGSPSRVGFGGGHHSPARHVERTPRHGSTFRWKGTVLSPDSAHRGRYHGGSGRARGSTTTTVRCGGGSGHGSGVSQRHVHSRRRRNNCQRMLLSPKLNTLTVRGDGVALGAGGVRRWAVA